MSGLHGLLPPLSILQTTSARRNSDAGARTGRRERLTATARSTSSDFPRGPRRGDALPPPYPVFCSPQDSTFPIAHAELSMRGARSFLHAFTARFSVPGRTRQPQGCHGCRGRAGFGAWHVDRFHRDLRRACERTSCSTAPHALPIHEDRQAVSPMHPLRTVRACRDGTSSVPAAWPPDRSSSR